MSLRFVPGRQALQGCWLGIQAHCSEGAAQQPRPRSPPARAISSGPAVPSNPSKMVFTVMSSLTCRNRDRRHLSADAARRRLRPWRSVGSRAAPTEGRKGGSARHGDVLAYHFVGLHEVADGRDCVALPHGPLSPRVQHLGVDRNRGFAGFGILP